MGLVPADYLTSRVPFSEISFYADVYWVICFVQELRLLAGSAKINQIEMTIRSI